MSIYYLFGCIRQDLLKVISMAIKSKHDKFYLIFSIIIGAIVRGYFISQPMRYDEAYTFLTYVNGDLRDIFTYSTPNNHVLHTILVKFSVVLWGAHPAVLRLPAFFAGLLIIPLTFFLCRIMTNGNAGVVSSMTAAVFPYLVLYSTNARGYTLFVCLGLLLSILGLLFVKEPSFSKTVTISFISALGCFVTPQMLLFVVGIYIWMGILLLIKRQSLKSVFTQFAMPATIMTFIFTLFVYAPVIVITGGSKYILSNWVVAPQSWNNFLGGIYPHIVQTISHFLRDVPVFITFVFFTFLVTGIYAALREKKWESLLILPILCLGAGIILLFNHKIPFPRTWIYILPFLFIVIDFGFVYFTENIFSGFQPFLSTLIAILIAYYAFHLISVDAISQYSDTGIFPEAPVVAKYLKFHMHSGDDLRATIPLNEPLNYYLWYFGKYGKNNHGIKNYDKYFVIRKPDDSIDSLTHEPVIEVFRFDKAIVYKSNP